MRTQLKTCFKYGRTLTAASALSLLGLTSVQAAELPG